MYSPYIHTEPCDDCGEEHDYHEEMIYIEDRTVLLCLKCCESGLQGDS